ncbi:hypothetical protein [Paraburkholderia fungorum]|uniref:hypothetical protein n=1 Tax=Paraburkholderia fungorum TaxID=134537 RepID=UPI003D6AAC9A
MTDASRPRRTTRQSDNPTLASLMDAVMEVQRSVGAMGATIETVKGDLGINTLALQGVQTKLGEMVKAVGEETIGDDGQKKGTGLFGRVARLENVKLVYDRWTNRVIGMGMAATLLAGVVWWLINEKIEHVLKGAA